MRLIRHDLLRRLVAALLVVAMGGTLVPVAGAQGSALQSVLDDERALELALAAAHAAEPGADPLAVFAEAYADAVDGVTAEAVIRLLGQPSMAGVRPPAADDARATAPAGPSPTPTVVAFSASTVPFAVPADGARAAADARPALRTTAPSTRPRAP